jgi:GTP-binding protein
MFVDHIKISAKAGDGGNGCVAFRREAFVPRGGPSGGDGGRGGSIILRADTHTDNLTAFFYEPILRAKHGEHGMGKECYGKAAPDKIFAVPQGTLVYRLAAHGRNDGLEPSVAYGTAATFVDLSKSPEDEAPAEGKQPFNPNDLELIADLTDAGQEFVLCQGGKGGLGNVHFKSSRNRVPVQSTPGEKGEEGEFYLELRKIADVGLVGYPNAGKSTLLTKVSSARPKVAAYPFTTLTPHIGVVELPGYNRLTVADIPGLIEGAHENVGLGHEFLRHIVRCKLLAFVIDMAGSEGRDPLADLKSLRKEIDLYDETLSDRPWFIVANKMDLPGAAEQLKSFKRRFRRKIEIVPISAAEKEGIDELKAKLAEKVGAAVTAETSS